MSQRVPSWDIDGPPPFPSYTLPLHHYRPSGSPLGSLHIRSQYEMAELTWKNGQLALHGLVRPCTGKPAPKSPSTSVVAVPSTSWNKHHPSGTLESVVNQVTGATPRSPDLEDWLGGLGRSASVAVDALVPCRDDVAVDGRKRALVAGVCSSQGSAAGSLAGRVDSTTPVTLDMWREDDLGLTATTSTTATATNSASPETENTSPSKRKAPALDDHVSISYTSSQTKHDSLYDEEDKGSRREGKKPFASKKSRAAAIHNQSERKRRDKINQRMKTLQKMVPNWSKTDKASMLDEVIEYLKQLQAQVQVMSNMMMPMAVPLMPHIPQVPQTAMAIGTMMDVASMGRSMPATLPLLHPTTLLPLAAPLPDPYSSLLAPRMAQFLQRPMSLEEYSRMAAWIHPLLQHNPPADPKS